MDEQNNVLDVGGNMERTRSRNEISRSGPVAGMGQTVCRVGFRS